MHFGTPVVPDELPEGAEYDAMIARLKSNEIVTGKFLSPDGTLALAVIALERRPKLLEYRCERGTYQTAGCHVSLTESSGT